MKFSLFYEMQISQPTRDKEAECFRQCLEQAELADRAGYDCIWAVEHHGLYEYSHSAAPEIFLSFVAARTRRIRVGHGVTLTPFRYNHPLRIAERIAALDIFSGGRVNWGSGKSSSKVEQVAFENDLTTLHEQWLEALEMIPRMWQQDVFEWKGRFFNIPPTQVIPKPVQRPHPPILVGGTGSPRSIRLAVQYADEYNMSSSGPEECADAYARMDAECRRVGRDPKTLRRSVMAGMLMGANEAEMSRRVAAQIEFIGDGSTTDPGAWLEAHRPRWVMGTPDEARAMVRRFAAAGAERMMLQTMLPRDHAMIELAAAELIGKV